MLTKLKEQLGQSVLELMIAMSIFVLVVSGIMFLVLDAHSANRQGGERTKAAFLTQEAFEATQSIANQGWNKLVDGEYGLDNSSGYWDLSGAVNVIENRYTRKITVESVYRDGNGDITDAGGTFDIDTKKVTTQTLWDFTTARPSDITLEYYFTNWQSTDWLQTTQAEFDQGIYLDTVSTLTDDGEIELANITGQGSHNWTYDVAGDYTYDSGKIEITGLQARLLDQGGSTVSSSNPGFDTGETPWQYFDWSQEGGDPNVAGRWRNSYGNPGGGVRIRIPRDRNYQTGGWYENIVTINDASPANIDLDFDWRVATFNNPASTFEVMAFVDNFSGEPIYGSEVWNSGYLSGTSGWASVNVDLSSILLTPGTHYLKLAIWSTAGGSRAGSFDVRFDNAAITWSTSLPTYPTDSPTIIPTLSFSSSEIISWLDFQETATKNGGEIYYELSNNNGDRWRAWRNNAWRTARVDDYMTADIAKAHITDFPVGGQQLLIKAYLVSDGSQQVILDNIRVVYESSGGSTQYATYGIYDSPAFDMGTDPAVINYIDWQADEPSPSFLEFQLRTSDTQDNLATATWVGPDGTNGTYYTTPETFIITDPAASGSRWIQWRGYFYSDGLVTPTLRSVNINYE